MQHCQLDFSWRSFWVVGGVVLYKTGNGVNRIVHGVITTSGSYRVITKVSGGARTTSFPICSSFGDVGRRTSIVVSFSGPTLLGSLLRCSTTGGVPIIVTAAKFSSSRGGRVRGTTARGNIFFACGVDLKVGLLTALTGGTISILKGSFSVRVVRGRRGRGVSTPDNATLVLTSTVYRRVSGPVGCRCSERDGHRGHDGGRVNVRTIHNNAVINRRRVVFTNESRVVALSRSTEDGRVFTINTIGTTGCVIKGNTNLCAVGSLVGWFV